MSQLLTFYTTEAFMNKSIDKSEPPKCLKAEGHESQQQMLSILILRRLYALCEQFDDRHVF